MILPLRYFALALRIVVLPGFLSFALLASLAAEPPAFWQIGQRDTNNAEFALAPNDYRSFAADGFFIVGRSSAKNDWPYVQPGPEDIWAGGRAHTFAVVFGVKAAAAEGSCRLLLDLLAVQSLFPPTLRIDVNGRAFEQRLPAAGGDDSIHGAIANGRPHRAVVEFPAALLKAGNNRIELTSTAGSWLLYDAIALEASPGVESAPVASPDTLVRPVPSPSSSTGPALKEIVIVYKTHFDIGYTQLARDVCHQYRTEMADKVLEAIKRNANQPKEKQFVWTLSGYPLSQILGPEQAPDRREKIAHAIRSGNLAVHALAFSMHDETFEPEDLVRSLNWSSTIAREHGLPLPRDAKTTDVPGHSWILPTLLTHAGVKFFQMGGPLVNKTFSLPGLFWWEGPDGSRLLTLYRNDYGTERMPPKGWPSSAWLFLHMTADNEGPPPPNVVEADLNFYQQNAPGVKVRVGKLEDFADLVLAEKLELPVVRSDLPDPWIHGLLSHPDVTRLAHNLRPAFPTLDALTTLERTWGIYRPSVRAALTEAYRNSALYSEHTWGLATQHYIRQLHGQTWDEMLARGWAPAYEVLEESNREHDDYILRARLAVENPLADALSSLADHVKLGGARIVVFNPLPWTRDGLVQVNANSFPTTTGVRCADTQQRARVARSDTDALEGPPKIVTFVAKGLPPMGYRTYVFENVPPAEPVPALLVSETNRTIESPWFKAVFDPQNGRIASLVDKRTGRELVDASAPQGFGQYFYERFGRKEVVDYLDTAIYPQYKAHRNIMAKGDLPESIYQSGQPKNLKIRFEQSPIAVSAVMFGTLAGPGPAQTVASRLTLYADLPVADLEVRCQKPLDAWPEAGWICLPFKLDQPTFRLGKLGGDLDFAKDINVDWCNRRQLWLNTGAAVYEPSGYGVGVCPLDSPLVSLGEPGLHKAGATYQPEQPWLYFNLYNNQWQTNFRNWTGGNIVARVRLWTFDKFQSEPALYSPAMEARVPLRVAGSHQPAGHLPVSQAGLTLSRKGIMVTAFGEDPDGNAGTLLRLWEQGGTSGPLIVTLPAGLKVTTAQPVNLRGEKTGQPISLADGKLTFALPAYAPASLVLNP